MGVHGSATPLMYAFQKLFQKQDFFVPREHDGCVR